jgi:hypothetical protein
MIFITVIDKSPLKPWIAKAILSKNHYGKQYGGFLEN